MLESGGRGAGGADYSPMRPWRGPSPHRRV